MFNFVLTLPSMLLLTIAIVGFVHPTATWAQAEQTDADIPAEELTVYEQAQGLWLVCSEMQQASTSETLEADYRHCNAVYNALGKAVGGGSYAGEDLKWLYFYMGRTSASMALMAISADKSTVSEPACASVERADWTFQKVEAEPASWEAEVIAQYKLDGLVKTCRGKFGIPQWRQK